MIFLIDGHNLIPHIPGLSLKELDDECQLIGMLQEFSRVSRQRVEVYFDKAPAGQSGTRNYGAVKAHFIREDSTADEAIISRVRSAGREAAGCLVVTSDHRVQNEVRTVHARVVDSSQFAKEIIQKSAGTKNRTIPTSQWMRLRSNIG